MGFIISPIRGEKGKGKEKGSETFSYLEHHLDIGRHGDSIAVRKSENLVVIQHSVEILNPNGVDRSIGNDPRVVGVGTVVELGPHRCEDTSGPLAGHGVDLTIPKIDTQ
jgi:hypothetical protein